MTPLLKPLRNGSGTIYAFPSAVEDIGLNLDSTGNKIALSKFVVLNLPSADTSDDNPTANHFNFTNIPGIANMMNNNTSLNERQKVAAALQNYMANFETTIVNQYDYDYSASATVSERVFWKFLKETGAIRWVPVDTDTATLNGKRIYMEEEESVDTGYKRVVQSVGRIGGGNSVSGDFGMYNETYVNIPSTYGASQIFFKIVEDKNYRLGEIYTSDDKEYLSGRDGASSAETYTINYPAYDSLSDSGADDREEDIVAYVDGTKTPWYKMNDETNDVDYSYFTEEEFDPESNNSINYTINLYGRENELKRSFVRSRLDGVQLVSDIDEIDNIYRQYFSKSDFDLGYISFDTINIEQNLIKSANYDFNAILLYYTIYDKDNNNELATNLFGIIFLNSPEVENGDAAMNSGDSLKFNFPVFNKKKSNGAGSETYFGTGYSFKVNIRSLSIYDNTDAFIQDETTSASLYTEDCNDVIYNLNRAVESLQNNSSILSSVFKDYRVINSTVDSINSTVQKLEQRVNELNTRKLKDIQSENITVSQDFESKGRSVFSGEVVMDSSIQCEIPFFDVSTLKASEVNAEDASVKNMEVEGTANIKNIFAEYLDVSTMMFRGGSFDLTSTNQYLDLDSNSLQEVKKVEGSSFTDTALAVNAEKIGIIMDKMKVVNYNGKFELEPTSFENWGESVVELRPSLYKVKEEQTSEGTVSRGFVSYVNFIPLLISEINTLKEDIKKLKGE